jgi:predicted phage terminase large subunit-like protein
MVRPEDAQRERVLREKARRHLVDFVQYQSPWYRAARHHRLVAEYLELVETYIRTGGRTGIGRLMILMPPRHGKTELVSKHFPAWVMGKNPDKRVIMCSYGADLAVDNSRAVRNMVDGNKYRAVFGELAGTANNTNNANQGAPVELSTDSRSVEAWGLAAPNRGGMTAAGVGGAITGKGAHLLIVDDPVKNRDEAESETARQRVWDWWTSTAYTRLEEGSAIILIQTRWHGDDLAGRLLSTMAKDPKADQWVALCLMGRWEEPDLTANKEFETANNANENKGINWERYFYEQLSFGVWEEKEDPLGRKEGQALWPEKYDEGDLGRIEANVGPYDFQALYQQRPFARQGRMFKRDWFVTANEPPTANTIVERVRFWDKAGTEGGGAFTCGVLMCRTTEGQIYVEHVERGQWETYERDERIVATGQSDRQRPGPTTIIWHEREPGSAGEDSAKSLAAKLARAGLTNYFELPTGSKEVRAGPWSSACMAGIVRLVNGGWNKAFIEEHVAFPKGRYKDQVDASSGAYGKVGVMGLDGQLFY